MSRCGAECGSTLDTDFQLPKTFCGIRCPSICMGTEADTCRALIAPLILTQACKEFEQRVGQLKSPRGEKTALIEAAIARQPGDFSVSDLQNECPGVSVDLVRQALKRQKDAAQLICLGRGPAAKWRKAAN